MRLASYTAPQTARLNRWPIHSRESAVSREWDGYCFQRCLRSSVGWFHTSQFNNKHSSLSGNSKRDSRRFFVKRDHNANKRSSLAQWWWTSQYCCNGGSLDLLGLGNPSTSTTQSWCAPSDVHLNPKIKKHLRGQHFHSSVDVPNEVKKLLCAQDAIFMCKKDLTNWYRGKSPNMGRCIISYQEVLQSLLKNVNDQAHKAVRCNQSINCQLFRTSVVTGRLCFGTL